jgi:hypothetical protein
VLVAEGLVLEGEFVDDVGLGADELFEARAVFLERVVVALQLGVWVVVVPELGRRAAGVVRELLEVVAEVGVFLRDDPVLTSASTASWTVERLPVERCGEPASSRSAAWRMAMRWGSVSVVAQAVVAVFTMVTAFGCGCG